MNSKKRIVKNCKSPEDFVEIYKQSNNSRNYLVKHYKVSPTVIDRWAKENNVQFVNKFDPRPFEIINNLDLNLFTQSISSSVFLDDVCKQFNINVKTLRNICKRNNIEYSNLIKSGSYVIPDRQELLEHINSGKYIGEIGKIYNVSRPVVKRWLKNLKLSATTHLKNIPEDFKENYSKLSYSELKDVYNTTYGVIYRWSNELGLPKKLNRFEISKENYNDVLNNFNILQQENTTKPLYQIAAEKNISYSHIKKAFQDKGVLPKIHSYNKSKGELEVKQFIKDLQFDCHSIKPIFNNERYEIDCFIKDKNFGIEYCGEFWHSSDKTLKNYHRDKHIWCSKQNINLMTIFEHEWISKQQIVKSMIRSKLGIIQEKIYARNCEIKKISNKEANDFIDINHVQGRTGCSCAYGLYHKEKLVSVMTFSKPRFNKKYDWELVRFCNSLNTIIIGSASKLFKQFKNDHMQTTIISYADCRFGNGDLYDKVLGFDRNQKITTPNYWYFHPKIGVFENRIKYQKHKLQNILERFDVKLTETENMKNNGFFVIYDCGNYSFSYKNL